jgi:hypothetical protein
MGAQEGFRDVAMGSFDGFERLQLSWGPPDGVGPRCVKWRMNSGSTLLSSAHSPDERGRDDTCFGENFMNVIQTGAFPSPSFEIRARVGIGIYLLKRAHPGSPQRYSKRRTKNGQDRPMSFCVCRSVIRSPRDVQDRRLGEVSCGTSRRRRGRERTHPRPLVGWAPFSGVLSGLPISGPTACPG